MAMNTHKVVQVVLGCHLQIIIPSMLATKYTFYNELSVYVHNLGWIRAMIPMITQLFLDEHPTSQPAKISMFSQFSLLPPKRTISGRLNFTPQDEVSQDLWGVPPIWMDDHHGSWTEPLHGYPSFSDKPIYHISHSSTWSENNIPRKILMSMPT